MKLSGAAIPWTELDKGSPEPARVLFSRTRIDNLSDLSEYLGLPRNVDDNTLLLALYARDGEQCADRILGDFAFAIVDYARAGVYCARDIMGCQPLYFCANDTGLFIGERIDDVLAFDEVSDREDEPFIAAFLSYSFAHFERTALAEVRKVPPAHFGFARKARIAFTRYWHPGQIMQRDWPSHEQCLEEFRAIIRQAIIDRLPESGPVGVHVSGGLDCSAIAILTAQICAEQGREPPLALTWYPPPESSMEAVKAEEYERVQAVCDAIGVQPHYTEPSPEHVLSILRRDHRTRPICNATYNEQLSLRQAKYRGAKVVFSGFGGDEAASFDGRGYTHELAMAGNWRELRKFAISSNQSTARYAFGQLVLALATRFLSDHVLNYVIYELARGRWRTKLRFAQRADSKASDDEARPYLSPKASQNIEKLPPIPVVRYKSANATMANLLTWPGLVVRIEPWHQQAREFGIRHSYPLLDRRVIEFALSLPGSAFRDPQWKRLFFRQAMEPYLPSEVCWRHVKSDPARIDPLLVALKAAFATIGRDYRGSNTWPDRARYVDMERLLPDLEMEALDSRTRWGKLISAMEFIGAGSKAPTPRT